MTFSTRLQLNIIEHKIKFAFVFVLFTSKQVVENPCILIWKGNEPCRLNEVNIFGSCDFIGDSPILYVFIKYLVRFRLGPTNLFGRLNNPC